MRDWAEEPTEYRVPECSYVDMWPRIRYDVFEASEAGMSDSATSPDFQPTTGERSFMRTVLDVFSISEASAMDALLKVRSFIAGDGALSSLHAQAVRGDLTGSWDSLFERVRDRVVKLELSAIIRQVASPLIGGYLGYWAAGALGLTGGAPILIGALIGAVIWLSFAPGTMDMINRQMSKIIDEIFKPVWSPSSDS